MTRGKIRTAAMGILATRSASGTALFGKGACALLGEVRACGPTAFGPPATGAMLVDGAGKTLQNRAEVDAPPPKGGLRIEGVGMDEHIIKGEADVTEGAAWLARAEPRFEVALGQIGTLPLRLRSDGFEALLSAIVSQQISVAAARGVWAKLEAAGAISADAILTLSEEELRGIGLSRQKAGYAKALAEHRIDFVALRSQRSANVVRELTAVKGIGLWTAEIYCMFSLGRADVFAAGDLALQESARVLFALPERPKEKELRQMAEAWSPWRAVAARLLFTYYHLIKDREGMT